MRGWRLLLRFARGVEESGVERGREGGADFGELVGTAVRDGIGHRRGYLHLERGLLVRGKRKWKEELLEEEGERAAAGYVVHEKRKEPEREPRGRASSLSLECRFRCCETDFVNLLVCKSSLREW